MNKDNAAVIPIFLFIFAYSNKMEVDFKIYFLLLFVLVAMANNCSKVSMKLLYIFMFR